MGRFLRGLIAVSSCLIAAGVSTSEAQSISGSEVSGIVRDSTGGALPGATVTMTKTDTGQTRTVVTDGDGAYSIPGLPVGTYQLKVALDGFNTQVRDGIVLQVGSNPAINVTLSVAAHVKPRKSGPTAAERLSTRWPVTPSAS